MSSQPPRDELHQNLEAAVRATTKDLARQGSFKAVENAFFQYGMFLADNPEVLQ